MNNLQRLLDKKAVSTIDVLADLKKTIAVRGSLGHAFTKALEICYSKRDNLTGEPNFGAEPTGELQTGSLAAPIVTVGMESQQMESDEIEQLADQISTELGLEISQDDSQPLVVYAIPDEKNLPILVESDLRDEIDGRGSLADFVLVVDATRDGQTGGSTIETVASTSAQISVESRAIADFKARGGVVYPSVESFIQAHVVKKPKSVK